MNPANKKFAFIVTSLILAIIILVVTILTVIVEADPEEKKNLNNEILEESISQSENDSSSVIKPEDIRWMFNDVEWTASSEPPKCEEPIEFSAPVNLNLASHILYPGQTRGGDYKAHGGFRFDGVSNNAIEVRLPFDAVLISGSRYLEGGERQVILDFISPCGIMVRFDHLLTLSDEFELLMDELPEAKPDDSRGTNFTTQKLYKAGTIIAIEIGHKNPFNPGMDFGFYDLRSPNEISQRDPEWVSSKINPSMASYARCWLDYLVDAQKDLAYSLPGPGTEGKESDYCE